MDKPVDNLIIGKCRQLTRRRSRSYHLAGRLDTRPVTPLSLSMSCPCDVHTKTGERAAHRLEIGGRLRFWCGPLQHIYPVADKADLLADLSIVQSYHALASLNPSVIAWMDDRLDAANPKVECELRVWGKVANHCEPSPPSIALHRRSWEPAIHASLALGPPPVGIPSKGPLCILRRTN